MRDVPVYCHTDASIRRSNAGNPMVVLGAAIDDGRGHYLTSSALPDNPMRSALADWITDAELAAALDGLIRCARAGYHDIVHVTDNLSAYQLLAGRLGTQSPATAYLAQAIAELTEVGGMKVRFEWVRRGRNREADALAGSRNTKASVIPPEIGDGYAARTRVSQMIGALRVPFARVGRDGFADVPGPWIDGVNLRCGVIHAERDAEPRAMLLAAGMLNTTPPAWRHRLDFDALDRRQATATIGEIASAWVWRHAADLFPRAEDLVLPRYLPALLQGTAPGLALVDMVWQTMPPAPAEIRRPVSPRRMPTPAEPALAMAPA